MEYVEQAPPRIRRLRARTRPGGPGPAESTAVADVATATPGSHPGSERRRRLPRPSLFGLTRAALAVVVTVAVALSLYEWTAATGRYSAQQHLRSSALSAASTYGTYLSSYDYANLGAPGSSWAEVDAHSTPRYRKDFDATKADLSSLVRDYKATAKGKVIAAGLSSLTSSRAVALLFIDQTITNTAQKPGTTTQPLRVQLVMVRQSGKWLIDDLRVPS